MKFLLFLILFTPTARAEETTGTAALTELVELADKVAAETITVEEQKQLLALLVRWIQKLETESQNKAIPPSLQNTK